VDAVEKVQQSLARLSARRHAIVANVDLGNEDAIRLKALGICAGRRVEIIQLGDPLIVRVHGTLVGLAQRLAERVLVRSA
jgi:Fe2+ transport system protein FeoA